MAINPKEIDRLLVDELNQLTVNEREQVMEEVHGVSAINAGAGDPVLKEALARMQNELDMHYYSAGAPHDCVSGIITRSQSHNKSRGVHSSSFSSCASSVVCGAYREARSKNSSLIKDIEFMHGHLVAENFNPERAALRLMLYLDRMKELYGTSAVLFRPIFIDDLHIKAREQLAMGSYQILSDRDSSGRRIFVYLRDISPTVSNELRSQVFMFFAQKLVEERDGLVAVVFLHNSTLFTGIEEKGIIYEQSRKMIECMPSRFHAIHICMPNEPFYNLVKSAIMLVIGRDNRLHVRVHLGSHLECRYSLSTFGIPVNRLPMALDLNTTLRKDNITYHTKWVRMQKAKEIAIEKIHLERCQDSSFSAEKNSESENWKGDHSFEMGHFSSSDPVEDAPIRASCASDFVGMKAVNIFRSEFVECPRHEDCLFGRGRNIMKHPGNVAMRSILEGKQERYASAAHQKKSEIAWEVVNEIKIGGGRFLKELDTGLYTLVDNETARKKISIAFRDLKNKVGKRQIRTQQIQQQQQQQQNGPEVKSNRTAKRRKFLHDNDNNYGSSSDSENECFQRCF